MQITINKRFYLILGITFLTLLWGIIQLVGLYHLSDMGEQRLLYNDGTIRIIESCQGAFGTDYVLGYWRDSLILDEKIIDAVSSVDVEYSDSIKIIMCFPSAPILDRGVNQNNDTIIKTIKIPNTNGFSHDQAHALP